MKIIDILRMTEKGISQRGIASSAGCSKSTIGDIQKRCQEKGLTLEKAEKLTSSELSAIIYPKDPNRQPAAPEPDWKAIHEEMAKRPKLNLSYMWEEYRRQHPNGLSYGRFCAHARAYRETAGKEVIFVKERKAGDIMEVDWAGDTLNCVVINGEIQNAHFFITILGYSHYPYVEAFPNEQEQSWITGHVNALHYYGGLPNQIAPDNCKTAVATPKYYEPIINSAYWEMAQHYGVAIIPARVRKPRDKAAVESAVGWLETWLLERLRNQQFFSYAELNSTIRKYIGELSAKPFQKRPGSRYSEFIAIDKPALKPLPNQKYEIADVKTKKVPGNYHLEYDGFYYSVPYTLYGEQVVLRATSKTIEVLDKERTRIASHVRCTDVYGGRYETRPEHMPPNHQAMRQYGEFDGNRYRGWAKNIGENTYLLIDSILSGYKVEQQGYKSCMGILQSAKKYGNKHLEESCKKAREMGSNTYSTVMMFVKQKPAEPKPAPEHENIRGSAYYK